jgi:putative ABC transport system substrate-binding protein
MEGKSEIRGEPRRFWPRSWTCVRCAVIEPRGLLWWMLKIAIRRASRPSELDAAFAEAAADGDRAMVVQLSPLSIAERGRIVGLAARFRLPVVYPLRDYVEAGGLLSYGPVLSDNFKRAAALVDKILRGASAGELPFEQPTHFELVANLETAKELGLTIPPAILDRADEVIE